MKNIFALITALIITSSGYSQPQVYLEKGNTKFKLQDYRGAIEDYNKAKK